MEKKNYKAKPYFTAVACECGGCFTERVGQVEYMHDPVKADFKCNSCDRIICLDEPDFPAIKYHIDFTS